MKLQQTFKVNMMKIFLFLLTLFFVCPSYAFDWRSLGNLELLNGVSPKARSVISTTDTILRQLGSPSPSKNKTGKINRTYGNIKSEKERIKQGNTKFKDIPFHIQEIQNIIKSF